MIHLKIDGECVEVEEGTTILEAARKLNVHIPTLCYHEDQAVKVVCLICSKNGSCELQKVAKDLNMNQPNRYELTLRSTKKDESSPCIVRDMKKCILCGRCMESCGKVQGIQVMAKENRGFHTEIVPPYGKNLMDTSCVGCGQCVQVCPVGALSIRDNTDEVYRQMAAARLW